MYNVQNWYWVVGGSTTQVYSSAAVAYVPVSNSTYEAWLSAGNLPTKIDTEDNLGGVFELQYPAGWYKKIPAMAAAAAIAAGLTITSTGTPAVNGTYACDATSVSNFNAVETYVLRNSTFPGPASQQAWVTQTGAVVVIPNTTVFNEIATAIANYVALVQLYAYSGGQTGSLPASSVTIA